MPSVLPLVHRRFPVTVAALLAGLLAAPALAQTAPMTYQFQLPLQGLAPAAASSSAPPAPSCTAPEVLDPSTNQCTDPLDAWTQFFQTAGVALPNPWSGGFGMYDVTAVPPDVPYPASQAAYGVAISDDPSLTNLDGFSSIQSTQNGPVGFDYDPALTNIDGLSHLQVVGGAAGVLGFQYDNALTNVDGLSALRSVGASIGISNDASLTNLDGLRNLTTIQGQMIFNGDPSLVDLSGLGGIQSTAYNLNIVIDGGISGRPGFVPIPKSSWLCQPAQAAGFRQAGYSYASQAEACGLPSN